MRIVLFFDLPIETASQKKAYRQFRTKLTKEGFIILQKSVYTKLVVNRQSMELAVERVRSFVPTDGLIQILVVTENQFTKMITLTGKAENRAEISSLERLLIL